MAGLAKIAKASGLKESQVSTLFSVILDAVASGERVLIKDFGAFYLRQRKPRIIRSPQIPNGVAEVPAKKVIRFRPSPVTKAVLNGEQPILGVSDIELDAAVELPDEFG